MALGVVTALAATTVLAVSTTAAAAPVTGGTIDWGVRDSFRSYVAGPIANGTITTGGGATVNGDGSFRFNVTGGSHDTGATSAASSGSVTFVGHGGVLEMTISSVRVSVSGSSGQLVADVVSRPFTSTTETNPPVTYDDVVLATLNLASVTPSIDSGSASWSNVPAVLTASGADAFGGFYTAGTALDPVSFTLQLDGSGPPPDPDPDPDPDPSAGPGDVTAGTMTWPVSQQAWALTSFSQCRAAIEPAVVGAAWGEPGAGVSFPATAGTFDPTTGETEIALDGALIAGNRNQGNYRLRLSSPTITIGADGSGELRADVAYSLQTDPATYPTDVCAPELRQWTTADDVTVVTFVADPADRTVDGTDVTWTITPPWESAGYSFHPDFLDSLDPSLQGHFRVTDDNPTSTSSLRKPPAPIELAFEFAPAANGEPSDGAVEIVTTIAEGGALSISVANSQVVLPTPTLDGTGQHLVTSGALGNVTVVDTRSTDPGWNVNAQITDFTSSSASFSGSGLGWTPALVSSSDGQSASAGPVVAPGTGLSGATLGSGAPGAGRGTAVFGANLALHVPTQTPPGTYAATLTLTAI